MKPDWDNLEFLLSRETDGDLTAEEQAQLQEALRQNPHRREVLQQYHRLDEALAQLGESDPAINQADLTGRIEAALDEQAPGRTIRFRPAVRWVSAAAAVAILLIGLQWMITPGPEMSPEAVSPTVERTGATTLNGADNGSVVLASAATMSSGPQVSTVRLFDPARNVTGAVIKQVALSTTAPAGTNDRASTSQGRLLWCAAPTRQTTQPVQRRTTNGASGSFFF